MPLIVNNLRFCHSLLFFSTTRIQFRGNYNPKLKVIFLDEYIRSIKKSINVHAKRNHESRISPETTDLLGMVKIPSLILCS